MSLLNLVLVLVTLAWVSFYDSGAKSNEIGTGEGLPLQGPWLVSLRMGSMWVLEVTTCWDKEHHSPIVISFGFFN